DHFSPDITLTVNFDWDHPDRYPDPASLEATFAGLFKRTSGKVILPAQAENLHRLARDTKREITTFGKGGDFEAETLDAHLGSFRLRLGGAFSGREIAVGAGGEFNAVNALAALVIAQQ